MKRPIRNILVPVDFSKASKQAAKYAVNLTQLWDAKVRLVHAIDIHPLVVYGQYASSKRLEPQKEAREAAEKAMDAFMRSLGIESPTTGHNIVTTESIDDFIETEVTAFDADLVVMSTHGHTRFRDYFLGSVAKKIIHHSPCPVMTLTHEALERYPKPSFENVLHPTDFSEAAASAAKYAREFIETLKAKIEIMHVVDNANLAILGNHPNWEQNSATKVIHKTLKERLDTYIENLNADPKVGSDIHFFEGNVGDGICDAAKRHTADLVIMATHGKTGLKQMVLGSVAERVVSTAPCPVLTIRYPR